MILQVRDWLFRRRKGEEIPHVLEDLLLNQLNSSSSSVDFDEKRLRDEGTLRIRIPVFVPCFNNLTYLKGMVGQLLRLGMKNIIVVDNASSYPPLFTYLDSIEGQVFVVRKTENRGPRHIFENRRLYALLPTYFCLTDPDLEFNPDLPNDFLTHLIDLTDLYRVGKAGFALDISEREQMVNEEFTRGKKKYKIWEWESQHWKNPLPGRDRDDKAYRAQIDTTFAVYNKKFFDPRSPWDAIRVSSRYTCRHLSWYVNRQLPADEEAYFRQGNKFSSQLQWHLR
jgi:hypothetical protein